MTENSNIWSNDWRFYSNEDKFILWGYSWKYNVSSKITQIKIDGNLDGGIYYISLPSLNTSAFINLKIIGPQAWNVCASKSIDLFSKTKEIGLVKELYSLNTTLSYPYQSIRIAWSPMHSIYPKSTINASIQIISNDSTQDSSNSTISDIDLRFKLY